MKGGKKFQSPKTLQHLTHNKRQQQTYHHQLQLKQQQLTTNTNVTQKKDRKKKLKIPRRIVDIESLELVTSPLGPILNVPVSFLDKEILFDRFKVEIIQKYKFTLSPNKINKNNRHEKHTATASTKMEQRSRTSFSTKQEANISNDEQGASNDVDERPRKKIRRCSAPIFQTVKERIVLGANQTTRLLESQCFQINDFSKQDGNTHKPSLIVMTNDIHPPTILMHIPLLCVQLGVPILLLPGGQSSMELGRLLGGKTVCILAFTSFNPTKDRLQASSVSDSSGNLSSTACHTIEQCHRDIDSFVAFALSKIPKGM